MVASERKGGHWLTLSLSNLLDQAEGSSVLSTLSLIELFLRRKKLSRWWDGDCVLGWTRGWFMLGAMRHWHAPEPAHCCLHTAMTDVMEMMQRMMVAVIIVTLQPSQLYRQHLPEKNSVQIFC